MRNNIVVYSSDYCPYCTRAKALLSRKGQQFEEKRVDGNPELRKESFQLSGQTSVPQIWIAGQHIGGCDDLYELERHGKLDKLLAQL